MTRRRGGAILQGVKKYELTKIKSPFLGRELYRVRSLTDVVDSDGETVVPAGTLGGYVESEENLSQEGGAWIYPNVSVEGGAAVKDDAVVGDPRVTCGMLEDAEYRNKRHITIRGDAEVSGHAIVGTMGLYSIPTISGRAKITGMARVREFFFIGDDVVVDETADVTCLSLRGEVVVTDWAHLWNPSIELGGKACISGDHGEAASLRDPIKADDLGPVPDNEALIYLSGLRLGYAYLINGRRTFNAVYNRRTGLLHSSTFTRPLGCVDLEEWAGLCASGDTLGLNYTRYAGPRDASALRALAELLREMGR